MQFGPAKPSLRFRLTALSTLRASPLAVGLVGTLLTHSHTAATLGADPLYAADGLSMWALKSHFRASFNISLQQRHR